MPLLHLNVIQRSARDPRKFDTLFRMWDMARAHGLKTTTLLTRDTLLDDKAFARVLAHWTGSADELGVSFHDFASPDFLKRYRSKEKLCWLLPPEVRTAFYDEIIGLFKLRLGFAPASAGDYVIDAGSLRHLERHHPSIRAAVTTCFEEGVNMFRGNNHNWHLFNDGGPWAPFFPSRENALAPASSPEDAIDIVALPHLARDMVLALSSRNDLFASHPLNLVRARINQGSECPYHYRALEQWADQAALNDWEYYNIFVSTGWLTEGHWAVPDMEAGTRLYDDTLAAFRALQEAGRARVDTISEFAKAFRQRKRPHGEPHLCHWKDVLNPGARREIVWVSNSHYRAAIDLNIGGTLVDFRPYAGRLQRDMGPETPALHNGSYPFLVSSEHRGGFWNSGQNAFLEADGKLYPLWESNRLRARVTRSGEGWIIEASPAVVDLPGGTARVVSRWTFDRDSAIVLEREIVSLEGQPPKDLAIVEWLGGCHGTNEYPEDLHGVTLHARGEDGAELGRLPFAYRSCEAGFDAARAAQAEIPQAAVRVGFASDHPAFATLEDGYLFAPNFHLKLRQPATLGRPVRTRFTLEKLP